MARTKHALVTRMTYRDREAMMRRVPFTKEYLIPSLRAQTDQRFEWIIVVMPGDEDLLHDALGYPFTAIPHPIRSPHGPTPIHKYLVDGNYKIQTRVDSDDWLSPNCIHMLKEQYLKYGTKWDRFMIHLQPTKFNHFTKRLYSMSTYHAPSVSSFITLCQHKPEYHVLSQPHHRMHGITSHIVMVGPGYARYIIHDSNDSLKRKVRHKLISA